jgi:hypothetical protein
MIIAPNFTVCMRWSADQQFSGHSSILQKKKSKHAVTCGVQDTQYKKASKRERERRERDLFVLSLFW